MTRLYRAVLMVILIPLALTALVFVIVNMNQPDSLDVSLSKDTPTAYFDVDSLHALSGEMRFYSKMLLNTVPSDATPYETITSLTDCFMEEHVIDSSYVGTIVFYLNAPSYYEYGMVVPAQFCEYQLEVNGQLLGETVTYLGESPAYTSPKYYDFPENETGLYEVILRICSPTNYSSNKSSVFLFGSRDIVNKSFTYNETVSLVFACMLIFSIVFCAIQAYTLRATLLHVAFFFISIAATVSVFFADDNIVMKFIPSLPYQAGVIISSLSSPVFGIAMVYLAYALFRDYFPTKLANFFAILQIIPLVNMLCFEQVDILVTLSSFVTTLPYAICMYVFIFAYERREPYSFSYGIAVLFVETSVLATFATEDMLVPVRFSYSLGIAAFALIEIVVLAKRYSRQYNSELFYATELRNQLEAMQASENAFLNAQMKPHFLYNTLNTIADLCVTDSAKAKSLIESLSEYLKMILSLDNMQETVTLKRELEIAERYVEIESRRFPSIQFYKDFPLRLPSINMPPIVIQPLIENAIKHGVRKLDRPGMITLRIEENYNSVTFFVSDNGDGMEDATIAKLFERPKENKSIGIYNIDKRLKNAYGDSYGLHVESTKGLGTSVSFTIPKGEVRKS